MELLLLHYLTFCIVSSAALLQCRISGRRGPEWRLTPELTLVASFFLYTSAMPVSRLVWGTPISSLDLTFLRAHILGAAGLCCGLFIGGYIARNQQYCAPRAPLQPISPAKCLILVSTALIAVFGYIYHSVGMSASNLLTPYAFERSVISEYSTLDSLIFPAAIAVILHCYMGTFLLGRRGKRVRSMVLLVALAVTALLLVRGMRNLTQILWLPICGLALTNRRLPVLRTFVMAVTAFVLYSSVAVIRNVGLAEANSQPVTLNSMDPMNGELGTSYNVYSIYNSISADDSLVYGRTYFVDFFLNLVPRALWPNRPQSTAVNFSMKYFQTNELESGLGFSPVVEAVANFSVAGILPVLAGFSALVVISARYLQSKGRWGALSYSMMLPILVNWNRIDFNAAGKMFLVYIAFFIILDRLIYRQKSQLQHRFASRRAPALC